MLRAIGTSRRQVGAMIRYEAVITSLIGGVMGVVLGTSWRSLFTPAARRLRAERSRSATLIVLLVLAGARRRRARRSCRRGGRRSLDVLEALAYE